MSPHIRTMLDDAADDGDRPLGLDLAAVRTAGRRAMWRQRAIVGGTALGAVAVITSVALVLVPGDPRPFGPSDDGAGISEPPAGGPQAQALAPLIDALVAKGYEIGVDNGSSGSGGGGEDDEIVSSIVVTKLSVRRGDEIGSALVAEFSDLSLLGDGSWDPFDEAATHPQCAIGPVGVGLEVDADTEFAWASCDMHVDGTQGADVWFATGGSPDSEANGVSMVRSDGSGISVALSTEPFDRMSTGEGGPGLAELPLTHLELVDVVFDLDQNAPLLGDGFPPSAPPDTNPCAETIPPGYECEIEEVGEIGTDPLVKTLATLGFEATSVSENGSGASDGSLSALVRFHLTDDQGRAGSAAIGAFSDLETARDLGGAEGDSGTATWCAVAPVAPVAYQWNLADDPAQPCGDLEASGDDQIIVFVHDEPGAEAIGATLIRADGSVVTVSVSREPSAFISSEPAALAEVPLDTAGIVDVLERLSATTT